MIYHRFSDWDDAYAALPQNGPHHILDRAHLVHHRPAREQKRAPQPAALDMRLSEHMCRTSPGA